MRGGGGMPMGRHSQDLSATTKIFRNSLIEEFRLSEADTASAFETPKYASDIFGQADAVEDILRTKPHSLIKFKIFKRHNEAAQQARQQQAQAQAQAQQEDPERLASLHVAASGRLGGTSAAGVGLAAAAAANLQNVLGAGGTGPDSGRSGRGRRAAILQTTRSEEAEEGAKRKPGRLQRAPKSLPLHVWATWLSNHPYFSSFIICTIVLNAMVLGVQTFLDEIEDWQLVQAFEMLDHMTMIIFVMEIWLKLVANFWSFWDDNWNRFDFFVTAGSLLPYFLQAGGTSTSADSDSVFADFATNIRIFRTFRTLKMIAKFRSLRIIVRTIMEALQSLGFVMLLLFLLMYIFAVLAIGLFSDYSNSTKEGLLYQHNWQDMITSFRTLFQLLTLDQWYNIAKEISDIETINTVVTIGFFVIWVALGAFIFRNIFIGVMVKNFQSISQELADLDSASKKKRRLRKYALDLHQQMEIKQRRQSVTGSPSNALNNGSFSGPHGAEGRATANGRKRASPASPANSSPHQTARGKGKQGASHGHDADADADAEAAADSANKAIFLDDAEAAEWRRFVKHSLPVFKVQDPGTTLWPRDTLLDYLQTMERLQENMKEHHELQLLATMALHNIMN